MRPNRRRKLRLIVNLELQRHFLANENRYHLKDVIVGKIYFLLVRIKIKHMELEIRRRESTGSGPNTYNESETLAKYEIMDGAPVRGEFYP
jgi:vacuolar protein sorting-associated protein 26